MAKDVLANAGEGEAAPANVRESGLRVLVFVFTVLLLTYGVWVVLFVEKNDLFVQYDCTNGTTRIATTGELVVGSPDDNVDQDEVRCGVEFVWLIDVSSNLVDLTDRANYRQLVLDYSAELGPESPLPSSGDDAVIRIVTFSDVASNVSGPITDLATLEVELDARLDYSGGSGSNLPAAIEEVLGFLNSTTPTRPRVVPLVLMHDAIGTLDTCDALNLTSPGSIQVANSIEFQCAELSMVNLLLEGEESVSDANITAECLAEPPASPCFCGADFPGSTIPVSVFIPVRKNLFGSGATSHYDYFSNSICDGGFFSPSVLRLNDLDFSDPDVRSKPKGSDYLGLDVSEHLTSLFELLNCVTVAPTLAPTSSPTTSVPTVSPTFSPTASPTTSPTSSPTASPTTTAPTGSPTTSAPTTSPTDSPTLAPTLAPTTSPTAAPTPPTPSPTMSPTVGPTVSPTFFAEVGAERSAQATQMYLVVLGVGLAIFALALLALLAFAGEKGALLLVLLVVSGGIALAATGFGGGVIEPCPDKCSHRHNPNLVFVLFPVFGLLVHLLRSDSETFREKLDAGAAATLLAVAIGAYLGVYLGREGTDEESAPDHACNTEAVNFVFYVVGILGWLLLAGHVPGMEDAGENVSRLCWRLVGGAMFVLNGINVVVTEVAGVIVRVIYKGLHTILQIEIDLHSELALQVFAACAILVSGCSIGIAVFLSVCDHQADIVLLFVMVVTLVCSPCVWCFENKYGAGFLVLLALALPSTVFASVCLPPVETSLVDNIFVFLLSLAAIFNLKSDLWGFFGELPNHIKAAREAAIKARDAVGTAQEDGNSIIEDIKVLFAALRCTCGVAANVAGGDDVESGASAKGGPPEPEDSARGNGFDEDGAADEDGASGEGGSAAGVNLEHVAARGRGGEQSRGKKYVAVSVLTAKVIVHVTLVIVSSVAIIQLFIASNALEKGVIIVVTIGTVFLALSADWARGFLDKPRACHRAHWASEAMEEDGATQDEELADQVSGSEAAVTVEAEGQVGRQEDGDEADDAEAEAERERAAQQQREDDLRVLSAVFPHIPSSALATVLDACSDDLSAASARILGAGTLLIEGDFPCTKSHTYLCPMDNLSLSADWRALVSELEAEGGVTQDTEQDASQAVSLDASEVLAQAQGDVEDDIDEVEEEEDDDDDDDDDDGMYTIQANDEGEFTFMPVRRRRRRKRILPSTELASGGADEDAASAASKKKKKVPRYWVRFDDTAMLKTHLELINTTLGDCAHSSVAVLNVCSDFVSVPDAMRRLTRSSHVRPEASSLPPPGHSAPGQGRPGAGNRSGDSNGGSDLVEACKEAALRELALESGGAGTGTGAVASVGEGKRHLACADGYWAHFFSIDDIDEVWRSMLCSHVLDHRHFGDVFEICSCRGSVSGRGPPESFDLMSGGGGAHRSRRSAAACVVVPCAHHESDMAVSGSAMMRAMHLRTPIYFRYRTAAEELTRKRASSCGASCKNQGRPPCDAGCVAATAAEAASGAAAAAADDGDYGKKSRDCPDDFFLPVNKEEHILASQYKLVPSACGTSAPPRASPVSNLGSFRLRPPQFQHDDSQHQLFKLAGVCWRPI